MKRRGEPIPAKPERPPLAPSGITPPPTWTSGTIRETCSCGASIETPADANGRETLAEWRRMHLHMRTPDQDDGSTKSSPDSHVTTGEIRESSQQDVPFGFFPPVVEARQP